MLDTLFLQILNMSFTASFVILFVLLARLFLKKTPKIFSYALWSVVLFRLVCPFSFESVISLLPAKPNPIPSDIMYAPIPQINTGMPIINDSINNVLPPATPYSSMNPMQELILLGEILWLAGIITLMIYSIISLILLLRRLKDAVHERDNIYISETLSTPFVMGLFRPKIYLPANLTEDEKKYILLHEQTHIKRLDHVIKMLSFFILCLHWFNPLVWVAFFLSGRDMEMSCDERVIKSLGNEVKKDYSSSLLTLATGRRIVGGTPLAFGEGDTKTRIKNVLNYKKPAFWIIIVAIIAVVIVGICLLANPKDKELSTWHADIYTYRTQYIGSAPNVGNIASKLNKSDKLTYNGIELSTDEQPYSLTVKYKTDKETRSRLIDDVYQDEMRTNAIILFSLIENVEYVNIAVDGGKLYPFVQQYSREWAVSTLDNNPWEQSQTLDDFIRLCNTTDHLWDNTTVMSTTDDSRDYYIMTDEVGAIGCDYGVDKDNELDTLQMLSEIEKRFGFTFDTEWASNGYIKFQFTAKKPKEVYLRYCADVDNIWQQEYPIDSATYQIKVPSKPGVYSFFADITWENGDTETAYFGITVSPTDSDFPVSPWSNSAKDLFNRYSLALKNSDIAGIRLLTPQLNPSTESVIEHWKQVKISDVTLLDEDIREDKAAFELSVTVEETPDGFGSLTPGTATHYLYAERCGNGWYVESAGAGGRSQSDLNAWWNQPNLISSTDSDFPSATMTEYINGKASNSVGITSKETISTLHSLLSTGTLTTKKSVQDVPNKDSYIHVAFKPATGTSDYFIYEENGTYYIEQPYNGISSINIDTLDQIVSIMTETTRVNAADTPVDVDAFLKQISQSFQIKEGVARFIVPEKMPSGYDSSQLSVRVSGSIPTEDDGSNISLKAYEKEDETRKWQLGKEYIERMLDTDIPDGTEVYATFGLIEKDGRSKYYTTVSKVFPLRNDTFSPSVIIDANGSVQAITFSDRFNDKLTLTCTLPSGWSMKAPAQVMDKSVEIYANGIQIGSLSYDNFKLYRDETGNIPYMSVYNGIMLGSMASWDNEYTELRKDKTICVATCKPWHSVSFPGISNAGAATVYSKGILAYNVDAGKYIAMELDDSSVTDAQWQAVAKSVKLSAS